MHRSLGDCLAFAYTILVGSEAEKGRGRERGAAISSSVRSLMAGLPCPSLLPTDVPLIRATYSTEMPHYWLPNAMAMDARNQMECHGSLALSIGKLLALLVNSIAITKKALCTFCLSPLKRDRQRVHAVPSCQEVGNFLSFILRTVLIL